jgi:hypothetical protein
MDSLHPEKLSGGEALGVIDRDIVKIDPSRETEGKITDTERLPDKGRHLFIHFCDDNLLEVEKIKIAEDEREDETNEQTQQNNLKNSFPWQPHKLIYIAKWQRRTVPISNPSNAREKSMI